MSELHGPETNNDPSPDRRVRRRTEEDIAAADARTVIETARANAAEERIVEERARAEARFFEQRSRANAAEARVAQETARANDAEATLVRERRRKPAIAAAAGNDDVASLRMQLRFQKELVKKAEKSFSKAICQHFYKPNLPLRII